MLELRLIKIELRNKGRNSAIVQLKRRGFVFQVCYTQVTVELLD